MNLDITTKRGYDIATALRGPDNRTDNCNETATIAKLLTTSVLRHFVGLTSAPANITIRWGREDVVVLSVGVHHGSYVLTPVMAQGVWDKLNSEERGLVRDFIRREGHFFRHFSTALEHVARDNDAAREYIYWLGDCGIGHLWGELLDGPR